MNLLLLTLLLQQPPAAKPPLWQAAIESLDRSGRAVDLVSSEKDRLQTPELAPGAPPLLSFRYFEGKARHRFGEPGLVMDDASH